MRFFRNYLRYRKGRLLIFLLCAALFLFVFHLYRLPAGAAAYPAALCALVLLIYAAADFRRERRRLEELEKIRRAGLVPGDRLPPPMSRLEAEYQDVLRAFLEERARAEEKSRAEYEETLQYFTLWVHQIKTPIASMRLNLQGEDSEISRRLQSDLNRIEQYVGMVLTYLRLGSDSTDYVFREHDLDEILRPVIRKFSGDFILKKLAIDYTPLHVTVLTDAKWLAFVVEQLLSNAVKYTFEGGVSIYLEEPKTLCIRDTGVGIAPEDLPRIFERGFTGFNGRMDARASGLGLYLCRRVCRNLGHRIWAESALGQGTIMRLDLSEAERAAD